ncbi:unnamed protein product, partial [Mesorhabditis belari]|uniref:SAP domain-containing protein n=1 Tax=Mesorhabditis belari TaxID=2138241 RepID=A0AAF3EBQ4_9BILA
MASKDYDKMTVALLRDELKSRNLLVEGKKAELIDRLRASDKEAEDELLNSTLGDDLLPVNEEDLLLQTGGGSNEIKTDGTDLLESEKDNDKAKKRVEWSSSTEEKMARAARLGLPIAATAGTHSAGSLTDDAKANRAKRFGTQAETIVDSNEAKARRLARFGVSSVEPTPRMNAAKLSVDDSTKEKLLKRAQRFGLPVSGNGKALGTVEAPEENAKKRARLERFGLPV